MPTLLWRLFIAAELPADVRRTLGHIQDGLGQQVAPVAWVAPQALHLTLQFLGELEQQRVAQIAAILEQLAAFRQPRLALDHAGAFPNLRRPQVVWYGLRGDLALLAELHSYLGSALERLGMPRERRAWHPHVTLGRVRRGASASQQAAIGQAVAALPVATLSDWPLARVSLFRSELLPAGARHSVLASVELGGA
jgi:2'-5' RNA ligase